MADRPMTNKELWEALAIAENNIKSLKADLTKQRGKYRAAKKECPKYRRQTQRQGGSLMKLPIPTYRSDEFMGKTHVCGIKDVEKIVFALWISRATLCKYFDFKRYLFKHPASRMELYDMCLRMQRARLKCLKAARQYGELHIIEGFVE